MSFPEIKKSSNKKSISLRSSVPLNTDPNLHQFDEYNHQTKAKDICADSLDAVSPNYLNLLKYSSTFKSLHIIFQELLKNKDFMDPLYSLLEALFKKELIFLEAQFQAQKTGVDQSNYLEWLLSNLSVFKKNLEMILPIVVSDFFQSFYQLVHARNDTRASAKQEKQKGQEAEPESRKHSVFVKKKSQKGLMLQGQPRKLDRSHSVSALTPNLGQWGQGPKAELAGWGGTKGKTLGGDRRAKETKMRQPREFKKKMEGSLHIFKNLNLKNTMISKDIRKKVQRKKEKPKKTKTKKKQKKQIKQKAKYPKNKRRLTEKTKAKVLNAESRGTGATEKEINENFEFSEYQKQFEEREMRAKFEDNEYLLESDKATARPQTQINSTKLINQKKQRMTEADKMHSMDKQARPKSQFRKSRTNSSIFNIERILLKNNFFKSNFNSKLGVRLKNEKNTGNLRSRRNTKKKKLSLEKVIHKDQERPADSAEQPVRRRLDNYCNFLKNLNKSSSFKKNDRYFQSKLVEYSLKDWGLVQDRKKIKK